MRGGATARLAAHVPSMSSFGRRLCNSSSRAKPGIGPQPTARAGAAPRSAPPHAAGLRHRRQHGRWASAGLAVLSHVRQVGSSSSSSSAAVESSEFQAELSRQWGPRWPQLLAALAAPTRHVALVNPFLLRHLSGSELPNAAPLAASQPHLAAVLPAAPAGAQAVAPSPVVQALHWEPASAAGSGIGSLSRYPPPPTDPVTGLQTHYFLDGASLLPPVLLDVRPGQAVLDMCAAPGGKSFVLSQLLFAAEHAAAAGGGIGSTSNGSSSCSGSLVCNEIDGGRRARLVRVLKSYVPEAVRQCVRVTPHDGCRWWGRQGGESFDRVLLDAPCSSDRHVAQQAAARSSSSVTRADWSLQRCRRIAARQAKLLAAGVKALQPGGRLVYSTCSILDLENDGPVDQVLDKAGASLAVVSHTLCMPGDSAAQAAAGAAQVVALGALAERTRHGWLVLPDAAGCGPIYLAVLHKLASSDLRRVKVNKYARST